jgi:hypothetical protein
VELTLCGKINEAPVLHKTERPDVSVKTQHTAGCSLSDEM